MTYELNIRTADQNDIPPLLALYKQLHPDDEPVSATVGARLLEQLSLYPGSSILLGLCDDAVVATCTLIVIPNLTRGGAPYALIENVVTDARHRKRSYGKLMLEAAVSAAWRHDCYKVMLLTGSRDPAIIRFYQDVGFEQSKTGFQARRIPPREGDGSARVQPGPTMGLSAVLSSGVRDVIPLQLAACCCAGTTSKTPAASGDRGIS